MTRRVRWPQQVVERARTLHERGYGYRLTTKVLADEMSPAPTENTVRDWLAFRTRARAS